MVEVPDEINMTEMLIGIKEDISSIKQQLNDQADLDEKADKALSKSIENEHRIDNLTHINYALISLVAAGIFVPLIIYLIEKFM